MKYAIFIVLFTSSLLFPAANDSTAHISYSNQNDYCDSVFCPTYSLGAVLGEPFGASPKFVMNNVFNNYLLQLTGNYGFNNHYGIEFDFNYIAFQNKYFTHSFGLGYGIEKNWKYLDNSFFTYSAYHLVIEDLESSYLKINYTFMWKYIFLQTAIVKGNGNYSAARFRAELGFLFQL